MSYTSKAGDQTKSKEKCFGGKAHLHTGMKLIVFIGIVVLIAVLVLLYLKFKKAMFVMMVPSGVSLLTIVGMLSRRAALMWPIIAISCFHILLSVYSLVIFSFYFIFKPFYIIMVLNWAFDTMHNDKTTSYYLHCAGIFFGFVGFLLFNTWQCCVAHAYHRFILRDQRSETLSRSGSSPTVLVVNSKPLEFASTQY